jgi:hypothetical protein
MIMLQGEEMTMKTICGAGAHLRLHATGMALTTVIAQIVS